MSQEKAFTTVDSGSALVRSAGCERIWSAYLARTVSLRDAAAGHEWLARAADELSLVQGPRAVGTMDFERPAWSEECNPVGASLVCELRCGTLLVTARNTALHGSPGILRELRLRNVGTESWTVRDVVLDRLPLALEGSARERLQRVSPGAVVAGRPDGGLVLGHDEGVKVTVSPEQGAVVSLWVDSEYTVSPGEPVHLPTVHVLPFGGPFEEASGRAYADFLRGVRALRAWEAERGNINEQRDDF